jgi:hypothetical protein
MNLTEAKRESQKNRSNLLNRPISTSDPFRSQAQTDYEIKKEKEKKVLLNEINRAYVEANII